jgi:hypothetical protein
VALAFLQLKFHFLKFLGCQFLSSFHSTNIHARRNPLATYLIKAAELRREAAPPLGEAISNPQGQLSALCGWEDFWIFEIHSLMNNLVAP